LFNIAVLCFFSILPITIFDSIKVQSVILFKFSIHLKQRSELRTYIVLYGVKWSFGN